MSRHERRGATWEEVHGLSSGGRARRKQRTKDRKANRDPKRFGKVNWESYHHEQLFDMIMRANPGQMYQRADDWNELARRIEATTSNVERVMGNAMTAWRGQAAVGAGESSTRLLRWAGEATVTASTIAQHLVSYTETVEWAQRNMPEPGYATAERNFRDGYTVTGTGGPSTAVLVKQLLSDGMISHEEARARRAEAVAVMSEYEAQSKQVHDTAPDFQPIDSGPPAQSETWVPRPDATPADPRPPATPGPGGGGADDVVGAGAGGGATSAAGFNPAAVPGAGGGAGGAGGHGGGGLGGGFGGGLGGGLGSLGSGGSDVVRNMPGPGGAGGIGPMPTRGPGGVGGVVPGGGRGAAGPGAFGGLPFGQAPGEEEKTHKNKYDEGMDFFDDLPPAYPSVFGA